MGLLQFRNLKAGMSVYCPAFEKAKLELTKPFIFSHDAADGSWEDSAGWQDGSYGIKCEPESSFLTHTLVFWHSAS